MSTPSMTTALEQKLAPFSRLGLAHLPTPLEPLRRLSAFLGGPRLWVKREDASGLGFGGNKLRKLDYVLYDAVASGADTLVSGGVVQSNSQCQVAAAAAKLGLECHLAVYHGRLEPPTEEYLTSGNAFLNRLFGAHLHDVPWTGDRNTAIRDLVAWLESKGHKPYFVPYGVSNDLGAIAYATTIVEIEAQAATHSFTPAAIVHCTGSAGTQAGLVVGASIAMPRTRIVGIDIDAEPERVRPMSSATPASRRSDWRYRSMKRMLMWSPGTQARRTALHMPRAWKRSVSPDGSKRFRSIRSIRAKVWPA